MKFFLQLRSFQRYDAIFLVQIPQRTPEYSAGKIMTNLKEFYDSLSFFGFLSRCIAWRNRGSFR